LNCQTDSKRMRSGRRVKLGGKAVISDLRNGLSLRDR
jgi:hypothetical protein